MDPAAKTTPVGAPPPEANRHSAVDVKKFAYKKEEKNASAADNDPSVTVEVVPRL